MFTLDSEAGNSGGPPGSGGPPRATGRPHRRESQGAEERRTYGELGGR